MRIKSVVTGLAASVAFLAVISAMSPKLARADEVQSAVARSPDGKNAIGLQVTGDGASRRLLWSVTRNGKPVLGPAPLDVTLVEHGSLADGAKLGPIEQGQRDEAVDLLWGKSTAVKDRCSWARAKLTSGGGVQWQIELRAYDDGVAFRYVLPKQEGLADVAIQGEATEFRLAGAPTIHFTACERFTTDHETALPTQAAGRIASRYTCSTCRCWPCGPTDRRPRVTEARIRDFTSMYLERIADDGLATKRNRPPSCCAAGCLPCPAARSVCVVGQTPLRQSLARRALGRQRRQAAGEQPAGVPQRRAAGGGLPLGPTRQDNLALVERHERDGIAPSPRA